MNTNDFYKELMSEYSFDYEKIEKPLWVSLYRLKRAG